ncbi:MAG: N-acetylneuraminate lyase [Acidobacteria bacterium]|nr:MAG: N-acetylneuraminate lyase [Acidobacteriota bacterium]
MTHRLAGLYAALATPYTEADEVSESCLRGLVDFVLRQKMDGFYVGGSTGEALLQTTAERRSILRIVAEEVQSKGKLIGHVGALSTKESVALAKTCVECGYHAVSAIPPIYFPYTKEDIRDHYRAIIDAAEGTPVLLYNIPVATGRKFSLSELAELIALPGIIGLKQTEVDMYQMEQLRRRYPELLLLNGYDEVFLSGLVSGADGGVGSTYNIMGWRYRDLRTLLESGDNKAALQKQAECNEVIDLLAAGGVFPSIKFILHKMGIIRTPNCRRPLGAVRESCVTELNRVADTLITEFKEFEFKKAA